MKRFAEDWNSSYLPVPNIVKRRLSLFTMEEQRKINETKRMRELPDLSAMMATQLGLPNAEPSIPRSDAAVTDATDATLQRRASSPGATAGAPKKKKNKKRSRDDSTVDADLEALLEGMDTTEQTEAAEPPQKKRKKKKQSTDQQSPPEEDVAA